MVLSVTVNILQFVITIMKVTNFSSSNCKCYKLHMINMETMLFRRWVPNVPLLTEQIQRHDVTQKMVAKVPDELLTLLAQPTTRGHIKKTR
jgi:hypothetical protein